MYANLLTEMKRYNMTINSMSKDLKMAYEKLNDRFSGKTDWTRQEMLDIKYKYFPNLSLDYLFENSQNV